jgi:serine/threonine-protein kinase
VTTVVPVSEVPSQRIERYELLAELSAGGMATVYLARLGGAGGFQRLFAIKRLHPHLAHEHEFVQMFLDEARLAARIHHPNVVPILEVGTSEAGYHLVMEYIEGETLARLLGRTALRGNKVRPRVATKVILDALAGLEAAHNLRDDFGDPLNIVHRDVSPQNVMVGSDGTARITDFGVARAATRLTTTRAGQLKGKLGYMAPEQAQGEDVDRRADVFGVGVMLWECLTGRRLFKSKEASDAAALNRLLHEPIPSLRDADPQVHELFDAVCRCALARNPHDRFASCQDFAEALEQVAQHTGGIASTREVAAFVDQVAGPEIAAQRDVVRKWVSRGEVRRIDRSDHPTMPQSQETTTGPFALAHNALAGSSPSSASQPAPSKPRATSLVLAFAALLGAVALAVLAVSYLLRQVAPSSSEASAAPGPPAPLSSPATPATILEPLLEPVTHAHATQAIPTSSASAPLLPAPAATRRDSTRQPGLSSAPPGPVQSTTSPPGDEKGGETQPDDLNTNPYRQ